MIHKNKYVSLSSKALRSSVLGWNVIQSPLLPTVNNEFTLNLITRFYFWEGQFPGLGLGYQGPRTVMRWDVSPQQWSAINFGEQESTDRRVYSIANGTGSMPVILCPTNVNVSDGVIWELTCLNQGWWYEDPPNVFNPVLIPPGPQYGQVFSAPNYTLANALFFSGNENWWQYM